MLCCWIELEEAEVTCIGNDVIGFMFRHALHCLIYFIHLYTDDIIMPIKRSMENSTGCGDTVLEPSGGVGVLEGV